MREPSKEEVVAAKSEAQKRFGRPNVIGVPLAGAIGVKLLVAPLDRVSYSRAYDLRMTRPNDVAKILFVERVLWPLDAEQIAERFAAAPGEVERVLREYAGEVGAEPRVEPLTAAGSPAFGLAAEAAQKLLDAPHDRALMFMSIPEALGGKLVGLVVEAPDPARYEAAIDARREATKRGEGLLASSEQLVLEAVRWPLPVDVLIDRYPGIFPDLWSAFARAGGLGLAGEAEEF